MSRHRAILRTWAEHWRVLRAWGRPLEEVEIVFRDRIGVGSTGLAQRCGNGSRKAIIRAGSDLSDALVTILHELAHLSVLDRVGHGEAWRMCYADAVLEVTGIQISTEGPIVVVDQNAQGAIRSWWRSSGNDFAARLLGVAS